jgi:hypothetical protein
MERETLSEISSRVPLKELHPRPLPRSLFRERCSIPRAPFNQLSKSPVDELIRFQIMVSWDFVRFTKHVSGEIGFISLDTLLFGSAQE